MNKKNLQKSCLQALENVKTDHPIIIKIVAKADCLSKRSFSIFFCWVLGHMGFSGNEKADITANGSDADLSDSFL